MSTNPILRARNLGLAFSVLLAAAWLSACSAEPMAGTPRCIRLSDCTAPTMCIDGRCVVPTTPDAGPREDGAVALDANPGVDASTADAGPEDASCGGAGFGVTGTPPDIIVLFDRSCSMRRRYDSLGALSPPTAATFASGPEDPNGRWNAAREALRGLVDAHPTDVRWGLMVFPDVLAGCGMRPSLRVAPDVGTGPDVLATLARPEIVPWTLCTPFGATPTSSDQPAETPTLEALEAIAALPLLTDRSRERALLLITDGAATCGATDTSLGAITGSLRASGMRTAALGFSLASELSTATPMMNAIADAGGLARTGSGDRFYVATSPAELEMALDTILAASLPCTFTLSDTPPEPSMLRVSLDDAPVAEDPVDGFTYDVGSNTITLHGTSCGRIQRREATRIGVGYGCGTPACVPVAEVCDGLDNDCDGTPDDDCLI